MSTLLHLPPSRLHLHPRNMRRIYPADAVRQMADSLLACGGNLQALLVIPFVEEPLASTSSLRPLSLSKGEGRMSILCGHS